MKNRKYIALMIFSLIIIVLFVVLKNHKYTKYDIDSKIGSYDLSNGVVEDAYMEYLKEYIYPVKLRAFIKNNFVSTSLLSKENTGNDMIDLMKDTGYEILFNDLFYKNKIDFDYCPVTDNFKKKFNNSLLDYYNLRHSDSCEIDCLINSIEKKLIVELYDDFNNTEPTYYKTHHFHYALDSEGNVDDVVFDYTE